MYLNFYRHSVATRYCTALAMFMKHVISHQPIACDLVLILAASGHAVLAHRNANVDTFEFPLPHE